MIFYGQELGISNTFGFDRYEDQNIGGTTKTIPHFKKINSLQPILYPGNRTFALDPDGDGMNSANEDLAGTHPLDPHSLLRILSLDLDHTRLSWASVAGKQYNLWSASNLNLGFSLLSGGIPSAGAVTTYTNPASGSDIRFYKVEVVP